MAQDDTPATGDQPGVSSAAGSHPPVVVKKYANRRLYNTESSSYITLDNLAEMVRAGRDFTVYDAKSGEDITRGVLTQIIVEEESKGSSMLPTAFLRQLIGFYGDSLQGVVPRYLEHTMAVFARQQQTMRQTVQQTMQQTINPFLPPGVEEMSRQNMAVFERALSLFNPFHRAPAAPPAPAAEPSEPSHERREMERLREEVDRLNGQLAAARAQVQDARERTEAARAARPGPVAPAATGAGSRERGGDAPAPEPAAPAPQSGAPVIALSPPASRGARRGRGKPGQGTTRA